MPCLVMIHTEGLTVRHFLPCSKLQSVRVWEGKDWDISVFLACVNIYCCRHLRPAGLAQSHLSFHCSDFVVKKLRSSEGSDSISIFLVFALTNVVLEQVMIMSSVPKPMYFGKHHLRHCCCKLYTCKVSISLLL